MIRKVTKIKTKTKKKRSAKEPPEITDERKEEILKDLFIKKEVLLMEHEAIMVQNELPNTRFKVRAYSYKRAYFKLIWI